MDAYVFLDCQCGMVTSVMEGVVAAGAARAVAVTGVHDVIARVEDVDQEGLTEFCLEKVGTLDGVLGSSTGVVIPVTLLAPDIIGPPLPFRGVASQTALVTVSFAAGSGASVVRQIAAAESVQGLALLTGVHDLLVQVAGGDVDAIAAAVLNDIQTVYGVSATSTSLVLAAAPAQAS